MFEIHENAERVESWVAAGGEAFHFHYLLGENVRCINGRTGVVTKLYADEYAHTAEVILDDTGELQYECTLDLSQMDC